MSWSGTFIRTVPSGFFPLMSVTGKIRNMSDFYLTCQSFYYIINAGAFYIEGGFLWQHKSRPSLFSWLCLHSLSRKNSTAHCDNTLQCCNAHSRVWCLYAQFHCVIRDTELQSFTSVDFLACRRRSHRKVQKESTGRQLFSSLA